MAKNKMELIEKLRELMADNRVKTGSTRSLPKHTLIWLDQWFDAFHVPGGSWDGQAQYYKWAVDQLADGKKIGWNALEHQILEENPKLVVSR